MGKKEEKGSQVPSSMRNLTWCVLTLYSTGVALMLMLKLTWQDSTNVNLDHLFAAAWSPFRVTFDQVLHHYGEISYTLGKNESGEWKIEGLTQNYRRTPGWEKDDVSEYV